MVLSFFKSCIFRARDFERERESERERYILISFLFRVFDLLRDAAPENLFDGSSADIQNVHRTLDRLANETRRKQKCQRENHGCCNALTMSNSNSSTLHCLSCQYQRIYDED